MREDSANSELLWKRMKENWTKVRAQETGVYWITGITTRCDQINSVVRVLRTCKRKMFNSTWKRFSISSASVSMTWHDEHKRSKRRVRRIPGHSQITRTEICPWLWRKAGYSGDWHRWLGERLQRSKAWVELNRKDPQRQVSSMICGAWEGPEQHVQHVRDQSEAWAEPGPPPGATIAYLCGAPRVRRGTPIPRTTPQTSPARYSKCLRSTCSNSRGHSRSRKCRGAGARRGRMT